MSDRYASKECPNCGLALGQTRTALPEGVELTFCPSCQFPLVLVAGKYRLEKAIGEGGAGTVYLARHVRLTKDTERVIKILKPELFKFEGTSERFEREVQVTSSISMRNEHIVRIYDDFGEIPKIGFFYVMEHLVGNPLDALLQNPRKPPSLEIAIHIFMQLCEAMEVAHQEGVVHRDLKPENLFLINREGDEHFVKVLDFGIAKPLDTLSAEGPQLTRGPLGTPAYMSPEQCSHRQLDARSDIYSMGVLLYELLVGFTPYLPPGRNASPQELLISHLLATPPPLRETRPDLDIPEVLERLTLKALSREPNDRFSSAREFAAAIESEYLSAGTTPLLAPLPPSDFSSHTVTPSPSQFRSAETEPALPEVPQDSTVIAQVAVSPEEFDYHSTPPPPSRQSTHLFGSEQNTPLSNSPFVYANESTTSTLSDPDSYDNLDAVEVESTTIAPSPLTPDSFSYNASPSSYPSDIENPFAEFGSTLPTGNLKSLDDLSTFSSPSNGQNQQSPHSFDGDPLPPQKPQKKQLALIAVLSAFVLVLGFAGAMFLRPKAATPLSEDAGLPPVPHERKSGTTQRPSTTLLEPPRVVYHPPRRRPLKTRIPTVRLALKRPTPLRGRRRRRRRVRYVRRISTPRRRHSAGCPNSTRHISWILVRIRPSRARSKISLRGRGSRWSSSLGPCVGVLRHIGRLKIKVEAYGYRPCQLVLKGRKSKISLKLKPYDPNDIEEGHDDYCLQK